MNTKRPDVAIWMMGLAWKASERSTCLRRKCGCIAADGNRPLLIGYNGAPPGESHCDVTGCRREGMPSGHSLHLCRAVHDTSALIAIAAKKGIFLEGTTLYCTHRPCELCLPIIATAGIRIVYFDKEYSILYVDEVPRSVRVEQIGRG